MKTYYYSKATGGFYLAKSEPDAVEITQAQHQALMRGQSDGQRIVSDANGYPVLAAAPTPSFADMQAAKVVQVNAAFTQAAAALTEGYPEAERLTWATQQAEVLAWDADENAPTPYLDGLAAARGISPAEMRQKTLEQTQLFMAASQQLVGKRQRLRDLVYEATSPEDLDAIQWDEPAA